MKNTVGTSMRLGGLMYEKTIKSKSFSIAKIYKQIVSRTGQG